MEQKSKMDNYAKNISLVITIIATVIVAPMGIVIAVKAYLYTRSLLGRNIVSDILLVCLLVISALSYSIVIGYLIDWVKKIKR